MWTFDKVRKKYNDLKKKLSVVQFLIQHFSIIVYFNYYLFFNKYCPLT